MLHGASVGVVAIGALWFVLGYAFYCTAFAAVGSLLSRSSDAANASFPLVIPLIVAYGMSFSVLFGHVSSFYRVLAFLPPTAPVAMPTIYAVGAASRARHRHLRGDHGRRHRSPRRASAA